MKKLLKIFLGLGILSLAGCFNSQSEKDSWGQRFHHPIYYNNTGYYTPVNMGYYPGLTAADGYYSYTHAYDTYNRGYYTGGFYGNEYYHRGFFNNGYYNAGICADQNCKGKGAYRKWEK